MRPRIGLLTILIGALLTTAVAQRSVFFRPEIGVGWPTGLYAGAQVGTKNFAVGFDAGTLLPPNTYNGSFQIYFGREARMNKAFKAWFGKAGLSYYKEKVNYSPNARLWIMELYLGRDVYLGHNYGVILDVGAYFVLSKIRDSNNEEGFERYPLGPAFNLKVFRNF